MWQAAGRASEISWITLAGLRWDPEFKCLLCTVPQSKTAKLKMVALVAGKDRGSDFFLDFGDFLATHEWQDGIWALRPLRFSDDNKARNAPGAVSAVVRVLPVCLCGICVHLARLK
ncbi:MAG: hypothetical protein ACPIOQ_74070 [Promethearchaeia archaeon]